MSSFVQLLEPRRLFAAGSLDITYGNGSGIGTDLLPIGDLVVNDTAIQPGDRVLVAGAFTPKGQAKQNLLARYTADGKRDTGFTGTSVVLGNPRGLDSIDLILTQADGKILLLENNAGTPDSSVRIVRLTVSGKVDTTFGKNGVTTFPFVTARKMVNGTDGSILIVGDNDDHVQVARLSGDGKRNAGFGTGGVFSGQLGLVGTDGEDVSYSRDAKFVSQNPDGTVVIAGSFDLHELNPVSDFYHPFVSRLTADGRLDTGFAGDGTIELANQGNAQSNGVATLSNGKVLLAMATMDSSTLMRFNADGSIDKKFAFSGSAALDGATKALQVQPDGKIVVQTPSLLQRFEGDGTPDASFTDNSPNPADNLVGFGSDGSILSVATSFKSQSDGLQYKIRPARRWSELAPAGLLAAADFTVAPSGPYKFSIQWRAELGIDVDTLASSSLQIVAPNGATYKATFLGTTKLGNGTQRTANYKIAAPGGTWNSADNGAYTVRLLGGVIKDTQGNSATKRTLGLFNVQIA